MYSVPSLGLLLRTRVGEHQTRSRRKRIERVRGRKGNMMEKDWFSVLSLSVKKRKKEKNLLFQLGCSRRLGNSKRCGATGGVEWAWGTQGSDLEAPHWLGIGKCFRYDISRSADRCMALDAALSESH